MSDESITTSWMWAAHGGVNGLIIDTDQARLRWYDEIGCACLDDDNSIEQSVADFQRTGVPAPIRLVPDDVMAEIEATVRALSGDPAPNEELATEVEIQHQRSV